jgi:serine/threonine-protein kinase
MTSPEGPAAASSLTWIGTRVAGRYEIRRPLAKGAMGRVFLAIQHPLGREVALKVLEVRDDMDQDGAYRERFVREAAALARLHHPNTVRIIDYGDWEGRLYLVMEYIEGPTLSALLEGQTRLDPERSIALMRQIAGSLAEAHEVGIIHRDLKPSNILVRDPGTRKEAAKVVDFGLVKQGGSDDELTQVGLLLGTPRYMAPEQIRGRDVDGRSDVYACGVLLFRMLTGVVPFDHKAVPTLLHAHLHDPPPSLETAAPGLNVPPAIAWTIQICLHKDPKDRFVDAWELVQALDACAVTLRDPAWRDAKLSLTNGRVVAPFTLSDRSGPTRSVAAVPAAPEPTPWRWGLLAGVAVTALVCAGLLSTASLTAWWSLPSRSPSLPVQVTAPAPQALPVEVSAPPPREPEVPQLPPTDPTPTTSVQPAPVVSPSVEPPLPPAPTPKPKPKPSRNASSPAGTGTPSGGAPSEIGGGPTSPSGGTGVEEKPPETQSPPPTSGPLRNRDLKNPFDRVP